MAGVAQCCGIRSRSSAPAGVERHHTVGGVHQCEQVTAHTAEVRPGHGDRGIGRNRCVHCIATR